MMGTPDGIGLKSELFGANRWPLATCGLSELHVLTLQVTHRVSGCAAVLLRPLVCRPHLARMTNSKPWRRTLSQLYWLSTLYLRACFNENDMATDTVTLRLKCYGYCHSVSDLDL